MIFFSLGKLIMVISMEKQYLFLDAAKSFKKSKILVGKKRKGEQIVYHYHVLERDKEHVKKEAGDYFMISFTDSILEKQPLFIEKEFQRIIRTFLRKYHKDHPILVIGLGNSSLNCDAFGSMVTRNMIATNHYHDFLTIPKVALFNPDVISKTGISSFKLVQMVVKDLKPDLIIFLDSLVTREYSSLNRVIEISDAGIIPGGALKTNKEINQNTFHIPILSIGIPFLYQSEEGILGSAFLDLELSKLSQMIAESLNQVILF